MLWSIITEHILESMLMLITSVFTVYLRRHKALEQGVQALLRTEIISIYNKYFELGYCPIYAKENIEALYKQYKALGGNGAAASMTETIRDLPTELKEVNLYENKEGDYYKNSGASGGNYKSDTHS
ncbi:MAG: hypothetical protein Q4D26_05325 [Clostridia bacterium]|nr:hypothetical protein [Clostridia bacterium]